MYERNIKPFLKQPKTKDRCNDQTPSHALPRCLLALTVVSLLPRASNSKESYSSFYKLSTDMKQSVQRIVLEVGNAWKNQKRTWLII